MPKCKLLRVCKRTEFELIRKNESVPRIGFVSGKWEWFREMKAFREMESVPESVKNVAVGEKRCGSVKKVKKVAREYPPATIPPHPSHNPPYFSFPKPFSPPTLTPGCPATYASCPIHAIWARQAVCSTWNTPFHCFKRRFSYAPNRYNPPLSAYSVQP